MARRIGNDALNLFAYFGAASMPSISVGDTLSVFSLETLGANNTNLGLLGADLAPAAGILAGGLAGAGAAGTRGAGMEFSHWVPARFGGGRSLLNGNYVTPARHYLHDPFRYPSGWQSIGDKLPAALQHIDRVPNTIKGGAAGGAVGAAGAGGC